MKYHLTNGPSPLFRSPIGEFAWSTEKMAIDINAVSFPPSNDISRYRIDCFRAADSIRYFPAFEHQETPITEHLTKAGDGMSEAGESMMIVSQRRDSLLASLSIEIHGIVEKLDPGVEIVPKHKAYLDSRMTFLRDQTKTFMTQVAEAKKTIGNVIEDIKLAKKPLADVLRELEGYGEKDQGSTAVASILEELSVVARAFGHLEDIVLHLEKVDFVLKNYDDNLLNVARRIMGCDMVSETDINDLWRVSDELRAASQSKSRMRIGGNL
jgi:hypothetical protein